MTEDPSDLDFIESIGISRKAPDERRLGMQDWTISPDCIEIEEAGRGIGEE
jgi:hypothetical protein